MDVLKDVLGLWISCGESINRLPALCAQSHGAVSCRRGARAAKFRASWREQTSAHDALCSLGFARRLPVVRSQNI